MSQWVTLRDTITTVIRVLGGKLRSGRLEVGVDRVLSATEWEKTVGESLMRWYRDRAEDRLREKTARYAKILSAMPQKVKIENFRTRWCSCPVWYDISFNLRIIVAPRRIVDYVVVHELSHLVKHDHSEKFWKTIERACYQTIANAKNG